MIDKGIGLFVFIIALAALAVVVSKRSNTAAVLTSFLNGFSTNIKAAISPVTK